MKKNAIYMRFVALLCCLLATQWMFAEPESLPLLKYDATNGFSLEENGERYDEMVKLWKKALPSNFVDVVFDASGHPTMDELFVFGTSAEFLGEVEGESVEEILLHFTVATDGAAYVMNDPELAEMVNFEFKEADGKRYYFTGQCSNAYPGDPLMNSAGVFFFQGATAQSVHIYLHNFSIQVQNKDLGKLKQDDIFRVFVPGSMASAFVVGSVDEDTNHPFTAHFHICGDNTLTGGNRSVFTGQGTIMTVLADIMTRDNSPIAICPIAREIAEIEAKTARVVFDDIVPIKGADTHVNGKLNLPLKGSRSTPSIDLGNANGFCEFNGGQYRFATPASNSMFYVCSMAICYKQLSIGGLTFYGIGSSVGTSSTSGSDNKVRITFNNGTFTTYPSNEFGDDIDVVARGWYQDYTDLRLSYESRINGGTFNNCRVYRCDASAERGASPVNSAGESLCYLNLPVDAPQGTYGVLSAEQVEADSYLRAASPTYGTQSLTPVEDNGVYAVHPYLPLADCEEELTQKEYIHNWVTVIPQMGLQGVLTMGGDVTVEAKETDKKTDRKNAYLFYARLNEYTKDYAEVNFAGIPITVGLAINVGSGGDPELEFSSVTNQEPYQIQHGLYTMLSFQTNQWYTISMPYDVANIYIIETTETQKGANESLNDFLERQGEADGKLASTIITSLCPDIFSGKGSGVYMNLIDIARKQLNREPIPVIPYNPNIPGHGADKAHFYLYEPVPDMTDEFTEKGFWDLSPNANGYSGKWQYATPTAFPTGSKAYFDQDGNPVTDGQIWMRRGQVYSFFLPDSEDSRYWDGKYLIFEGYGPQTINGQNVFTLKEESGGFMTPADLTSYQNHFSGTPCYMQGNSTFANYTTGSTSFFPTKTEDNDYVFLKQPSGQKLRPCEVMMLLPTAESNDYASITRIGKAMAAPADEAPEAIADNALPRVNDVTLVATAQNGITLYSYAAQQVSIYTLDGRLLYTDTLADGSVVHLSATPGVYLVKGQGQTCKLIVP